MNKNSYNEKGDRHGYWEIYYSNGNLWFKGNFINGHKVGLWEYYSNGYLIDLEYYII